jgi:hypothetical protein
MNMEDAEILTTDERMDTDFQESEVAGETPALPGIVHGSGVQSAKFRLGEFSPRPSPRSARRGRNSLWDDTQGGSRVRVFALG